MRRSPCRVHAGGPERCKHRFDTVCRSQTYLTPQSIGRSLLKARTGRIPLHPPADEQSRGTAPRASRNDYTPGTLVQVPAQSSCGTLDQDRSCSRRAATSASSGHLRMVAMLVNAEGSYRAGQARRSAWLSGSPCSVPRSYTFIRQSAPPRHGASSLRILLHGSRPCSFLLHDPHLSTLSLLMTTKAYIRPVTINE